MQSDVQLILTFDIYNLRTRQNACSGEKNVCHARGYSIGRPPGIFVLLYFFDASFKMLFVSPA
jgi:hypothetical protein